MNALAPVLVHRFLNPTALTRQYLAVAAFEDGLAEAGDFDVLLDCADMLLLAAHTKDYVGEKEIAHLARMALANVRDRYAKTRKLGVNGEERKALRVLVEVSDDFWSRQGGTLHNAAVDALTVFRKAQKKGE